ncbi:hypothetical protein C8J56DRAFT_1082136 [Mycena floridula]|nr:hypothetical protein C8J56DRAFT_1082136 [Mycena floridula]
MARTNRFIHRANDQIEDEPSVSDLEQPPAKRRSARSRCMLAPRLMETSAASQEANKAATQSRSFPRRADSAESLPLPENIIPDKPVRTKKATVPHRSVLSPPLPPVIATQPKKAQKNKPPSDYTPRRETPVPSSSPISTTPTPRPKPRPNTLDWSKYGEEAFIRVAPRNVSYQINIPGEKVVQFDADEPVPGSYSPVNEFVSWCPSGGEWQSLPVSMTCPIDYQPLEIAAAKHFISNRRYTEDLAYAETQIAQEEEEEAAINPPAPIPQEEEDDCEEESADIPRRPEKSVAMAFKLLLPQMLHDIEHGLAGSSGVETYLELLRPLASKKNGGRPSNVQTQTFDNFGHVVSSVADALAFIFGRDKGAVLQEAALQIRPTRASHSFNIFQSWFALQGRMNVPIVINGHTYEQSELDAAYTKLTEGMTTPEEKMSAVQPMSDDLEQAKEDSTHVASPVSRLKGCRKQVTTMVNQISHQHSDIAVIAACVYIGDNMAARSHSSLITGHELVKKGIETQKININKLLGGISSLLNAEKTKMEDNWLTIILGDERPALPLPRARGVIAKSKVAKPLLTIPEDATNAFEMRNLAQRRIFNIFGMSLQLILESGVLPEYRGNFPWKTVPSKLVDAQSRIIGYSTWAIPPLGPNFDPAKLSKVDWRSFTDSMDEGTFRVEKWSAEEKLLSRSSVAYQEIPLIVALSGDVLVRVDEVDVAVQKGKSVARSRAVSVASEGEDQLLAHSSYFDGHAIVSNEAQVIDGAQPVLFQMPRPPPPIPTATRPSVSTPTATCSTGVSAKTSTTMFPPLPPSQRPLPGHHNTVVSRSRNNAVHTFSRPSGSGSSQVHTVPSLTQAAPSHVTYDLGQMTREEQEMIKKMRMGRRY